MKFCIFATITVVLLYAGYCDSKLNRFDDNTDPLLSSSEEENLDDASTISQNGNRIIDFQPISSANYVLTTESLAQTSSVRGNINYTLGQRISGNVMWVHIM